ncbi:hypothetical protein QBC46DRAFT_269037 [Diplogelasinospora grovesii]|uniref:Uncharacterized protein n=1 Tax=Diplogelasinospora grovesii TaxID=303347 RepID=A0AAN6N0Y3_9PEZI|nr:hypothetical protein QBC46DRAFT_269037 [Diplogelasinospora grovesii]
MGRRPNALILQYFERGPKLQDQSNRYPHTCKACGEHFPRGRLDSLTTHLTKKCPAIGESDRVNALLALSGMGGHASQRMQHSPQAQGPPNDSQLVELPMMQHDQQRDWTALGVLAEVSRQIDLNDKVGDRAPATHNPAQTAPPSSAPHPHATEHFELHEQFTLDHPAQNHEAGPSNDTNGSPAVNPGLSPDGVNASGEKEPTPEERLREILGVPEPTTESTHISMAAAAAAAARLHPALLDPQLLSEEAAAAAEAATAMAHALPAVEHSPAEDSSPIPTTTAAQPWGEITYATESFQPHQTNEAIAQNMLAKGGFRLDTAGLNGFKSRHSRARFTATRRKQVQEVRKIGACIRCRVLRKTCSQGHPCDTCRKVLSPRVWRSGCVRTKFSEQLDLYSAGVQIVLAQGRINALKQAMLLKNQGVTIEAYHFPDQTVRLRLAVLQHDAPREVDPNVDASLQQTENPTNQPIIMIDNDIQDVPLKLEIYMREILPELIKREPSHFMQVTLQTALDLAEKGNDELLKKSLELWGLVEILDRERQWTISVNTTLRAEGDTNDNSPPTRYIKEDSDQEVFTTICLQLSAATERKAAATSKALLTGMQRVLQDSKVKIDFNMYFATLVLLNCVEKTTWAFKAWEQPKLRELWPLEKEPGGFTQQGYVIADLLRMLLGIRKALPRTACREGDGLLVTEEQDPTMQAYFQAIGLTCRTPGHANRVIVAHVRAKQEQPVFSPTDPRSFELLFCSTLLLPAAE